MMKIPSRFAPLTKRKWTPAATRAAIRFLTEIWDYHKMEYTFLCTRRAGADQMLTHTIRGDRTSKIANIFEKHPPERNDVYFCPNSFIRGVRQTVFALPSRYAWCDIDEDDPLAFKPKPAILWETSPGSFQGMWIWRKYVQPEEAQHYSRNLHNLYGGDSTWDMARLLRVPGTFNHKPERNGAYVRLVRFNSKPQRMPKAVSDLSGMQAIGTYDCDVDPFAHDPDTIMEKYRRSMDIFARSVMVAKRVIYPDKSEAVFAIANEMMRLDATDDEVACVLWVNPHFIERRQSVRELGREIARIRSKREAGQ